MKQNDFINKALKALETHTVYATGAFGAPISHYPDQLDRYSKNMYNAVYKEDINNGKTEAYAKSDAETWKNKVINAAKTKPCFAFDCCGLIKGIIWGWDGLTNKVYGGAVYESNGLPDLGAGGGSGDLISYCTNVSSDFSTIIPGEMLWINGHVGIYIGDAMAIECTTAWKDCVQKTVVTNIRATKSGEYGRKWTKHGRLPWVEYVNKPSIICPCCGAKFILA